MYTTHVCKFMYDNMLVWYLSRLQVCWFSVWTVSVCWCCLCWWSHCIGGVLTQPRSHIKDLYFPRNACYRFAEGCLLCPRLSLKFQGVLNFNLSIICGRGHLCWCMYIALFLIQVWINIKESRLRLLAVWSFIGCIGSWVPTGHHLLSSSVN